MYEKYNIKTTIKGYLFTRHTTMCFGIVDGVGLNNFFI